jgi:hypothetical protein
MKKIKELLLSRFCVAKCNTLAKVFFNKRQRRDGFFMSKTSSPKNAITSRLSIKFNLPYKAVRNLRNMKKSGLSEAEIIGVLNEHLANRKKELAGVQEGIERNAFSIHFLSTATDDDVKEMFEGL